MFSKSLHKKFFGYIENNLANQRNSFVLIGHPKSLQNKKLFEDFITTAKERNTNYQFKTLTEYYNTIKKNTDNTDATDKHR
jgi:putative aminopeptidase FrvX